MADDVQVITGTKALVAARLCNFKTGKSTPLNSHNSWLDANVKSIVTANPNAWIDILGHASRQWKSANSVSSHQLNQALSYQRCEAIKSKVKSYGPKASFNLEIAEGDRESAGPNPDDGYDRAVEIYVYGSKPKPPVPPKPDIVDSLHFEIRVVGGGSASMFVQADGFFFQIVDITRKLTAFYFYTGVGWGISIPKVPGPGSVTKMGPPTAFTTTRDTHLHMFNSTASLYQDPGATAGPFSAGGTMRLTIKSILDNAGLIFTHPTIIPISGGSGIQMPGLGSASEGTLAMVSAVFPFSGY